MLSIMLQAVCYSRIWCVYELFHSLVGQVAMKSYTYDMYTACKHEWVNWNGKERESRAALGVTDGLAAVDQVAEDKQLREKHYPMELARKGMAFACLEGNASFKPDKDRILEDIGEDRQQLDNTVHGRVAAAFLRRGLEEGFKEEFLQVSLLAPSSYHQT